MKSKIVKQFGAMLLAGTMIVTSGNVTTYAAEQTDESQEVDENTENDIEESNYMIENYELQNDLYNMRQKENTIIQQGEDYFICKEELNGKQKNVAYILLEKSNRDVNAILQEVLKSEYMRSNAVIALAEKYKNLTISNRILKELKNRNIGLKAILRYYNSLNFYNIYFENISNTDKDYGFDIKYNSDESLIDEIEKNRVDGFILTLSDSSGSNQDGSDLIGNGILELNQLFEYSDLYKKITKDTNIKLYYYDRKIKKYILLDPNVNLECTFAENNLDIDASYVEMASAEIKFYGTYLVCNNTLPDSMVFNLTGLEKDGDSLLYYTNGLRDTSYTGLCDYDGTTYYVKDGTVDYSADMLYDYNGSTWNIKNGKVDTTESMTMNNGSLVYTNGGKTNNETTLCKYNGEWYYIHNGKVDYSATTLYKYNGSWWYIENGKVNFNKNGLCKYNGSWWYISGGKVNFNATGLCKYNGSWWYVSSGRVNFNATGLCKYNGSWWYVSGGKVNFNATGLCKYNGSWWYVSSGRVNFNATGLCKYNGTWWYVSSGRVNFNATGLCKYNGYWFYVENGAVRFKNTLCKYNGTWWYINNGVVNFSKTTLCKYGKNWFAVSKGKVAWNYTGYINYNGGRYKVINGVVKF